MLKERVLQVIIGTFFGVAVMIDNFFLSLIPIFIALTIFSYYFELKK